jgi:hypothetical protein
VVNVIGATLPVFYIFRRFSNQERLHKIMQIKVMHGHAKESLDDCIPFQLVVSFFFCRFVPREIFQQNCHLLIMDGYGSHVIIKALEQTTKFKLDMVT